MSWILIIHYRFKSILLYLKSEYERNLKVINLILAYRYFSLVLTSLLFFFVSPHKPTHQKLLTISGLFLACALLTYLYLNNRNNHRHKLILIIIETIENSILLILSGGIASPFLWYFISTISIAVVEASNRIALLTASMYLLVAGLVTALRLPSTNLDSITLYVNTCFSYIIVVAVLTQLIQYATKVEDKTKCLSTTNHELNRARIMSEKTLKYCIDLYETVNIFNLDRSKNMLQELLLYFNNLIGLEQTIFMRLSPLEKRGSYISHGLNNEEEAIIVHQLSKLSGEVDKDQTTITCDFLDSKLKVYFVLYDGIPCGVFAVITAPITEEEQEESTCEDLPQIDIISVFLKVTGILLKKLEFDELGELLLISEEQNRIANEIHDTVLQKLFSISCKLYVLSAGIAADAREPLKEELMCIKQSVDITMSELREAIYGFSWDKEGEDSFKLKLMNYTDELCKLQGVEANTVIIGDTQTIRANQKNGLYRVICEAMNNAIRHGKAKHIQVQVVIGDKLTTVKITDDGHGFDYRDHIRRSNKGLGMSNIYRVIELLNGQIEIKSSSSGTEILLSIPSRPAA